MLLAMGLSRASLGFAAMALLLVPAAFLGLQYGTRLSVWLRRAWLAGILGISAASCLWAIRIMYRNVQHIPEWDFRVFWIYGELMSKRANVFDPAQFQQFEQIFKPSTAFVENVLNVGATYPPPTMFLFVPLGWFEIHTAYFIWYLIQAACLVFSAHLLRKLFFPSAVWGLALAGFLIFCLRSSWDTINFGQTNFLALLLLLLYWRDRRLPRAGLWLTLAIAVKFYSAGLLLDILLHRRWRTLAWVAASSAVMWLASLALLGPHTFFTFFSSPPASRLPHWAYTEQINQSLLAVVLRGREHWPIAGSPVTQPLFVALGGALTCATAWLDYRARTSSAELGLALTLIMGLLLYPGTLDHYALVLVIPLLAIWGSRSRLPGKALGCAVLAGLVYCLVGFGQGDSVFAAFLLMWAALAGSILFIISGKHRIAGSTLAT